MWYYKDDDNNVHGPFSSNDMDLWFDKSYFPNNLRIAWK